MIIIGPVLVKKKSVGGTILCSEVPKTPNMGERDNHFSATGMSITGGRVGNLLRPVDPLILGDPQTP